MLLGGCEGLALLVVITEQRCSNGSASNLIGLCSVLLKDNPAGVVRPWNDNRGRSRPKVEQRLLRLRRRLGLSLAGRDAEAQAARQRGWRVEEVSGYEPCSRGESWKKWAEGLRRIDGVNQVC